MSNWISDIRERIKEGGKRFAAASMWGMLAFLLLSWMELAGQQEPWMVRLVYAFMDTGFIAITWQILMEYRNRRQSMPMQYGGSLGIFLLVLGCFTLVKAPSYLLMGFVGLGGVAILIGFYILSLQETGETLFSLIVLGLLQSIGTSLVTLLSLYICLSAFHFLITPVRPAVWFVALYFSIFIVGWNLMLSWIPRRGERKELLPSLEKLLGRILIPVYLVLLLILYGYIVKIAITGSMPIGTMNLYASLAILGYAFFYFMLHGTTSVMLHRFFLWGSVALIPIVSVQLFGIYIRLSAYGLTMWRYLSLICTFFGILTMIYGFLGRSMRPLYLVAAALMGITFLTPFNIIDVPARDQQYRIVSVLSSYGINASETGNLDSLKKNTEDLEQVRSAYDYLRQDLSREADPFTLELISSPAVKELTAGTAGEIIRLSYGGGVDVSGFRKAYAFEGKVISNGQILITTDEGERTFSIGPGLNALMKSHPEGPSARELVVDGADYRLSFRYITFVHQEDNSWTASGSGYLLIR